MGTICENILDKPIIYRWKIKILRTQNNHIMVGIAPNDFDIIYLIIITADIIFIFIIQLYIQVLLIVTMEKILF